jgi:hypothetical protein
MLVASFVRGAESGGPPGTIQMKPGDKIVLLLTPDDKGGLTSQVITDDPGEQPIVTLNFIKDGSDRMLRVRNGYSKTLRFEAIMCVGPRNKCSRTNILPVLPNLTSLESWNDPITVLMLSNFKLTNEHETR